MKKLLLLISLAISIGINGQKITNLTEATTAPTGSLLMVRSGTTGNLIKRITVDNLLLNYIISADTAAMLDKYLRKQPIDSLGTVGTAVGFYNSAGDTVPPYIPYANRADLVAVLRDLGVTMFTDKYQLVYNALDIKPDSDTAHYQNDMVYSLDSAGYWDRGKLLYVAAQRSTAGAKINWITPGTYNLTDPGSTVPSFIKYQGFDMDGSSDYFSTDYVPVTDSLLASSPANYIGVNCTTLSAWTLTGLSAGGRTVIGAFSGTGIGTHLATLNSIATKINSVSNSVLGAQTDGNGYTMATRRGKTELEGYFNGVINGTDNEVSYSLQDDALFVGALNDDGGSVLYFYDGIISIILVMDDVSDADALGIFNIFNHFMNHMGLGL